MGWVRDRVLMNQHGKLFWIYEEKIWQGALGFLQRDDDPERAADELRKMVVYFRPELQGCEIAHFGFNHSWRRWEIGVYHPSLPVVPMGRSLEEECLNSRAVDMPVEG